MDQLPSVGGILASKYQLVEELGRGGMGVVFRARHLLVQKDFAIKVLLEPTHRSLASRFFLEAQAAGRVGHPGILEVYDVGEAEGGYPYIVMELLVGESLASRLSRGRLEVETACKVALRVLEILEAAHKAGVIHRDVKPQNVFVVNHADRTEGSEAFGIKLLDFGIAKFEAEAGATLTRSGEIIGSPLYMSPEQARGDLDIDARADVWSVGAMLFEMLTGGCAHASTSPMAVLARILTEPAPAPSQRSPLVPRDLDSIVMRALCIDRKLRWESARAMHDALMAFLASSARAGAATELASEAELRPTPERVEGARSEARLPSLALIAGGLGLAVGVFAVAILARRDVSSVPPAASTLAAGALRETGPVPSVSAAVPALVEKSASAPDAADAGRGEPETLTVDSLPTKASPARPSAARTRLPTAASSAAAPFCGPGEELSQGHCCPRGMGWTDGRCERPIAKTF